MRNIKYILSMLFLLQCVFSEETYDPSANALTDIKNAISLAKKTNKHVFVKVGGNWCGWCKLYARFTESDDAIMQIMNEEYVLLLSIGAQRIKILMPWPF
jgi:thioredoxin-related protein